MAKQNKAIKKLREKNKELQVNVNYHKSRRIEADETIAEKEKEIERLETKISNSNFEKEKYLHNLEDQVSWLRTLLTKAVLAPDKLKILEEHKRTGRVCDCYECRERRGHLG